MSVIQPLLLLDGELVLRPMTYIPTVGELLPGDELRFTCAANRVETQSGFENRNVANLMGFRVVVDCNPLNSLRPAGTGGCQYGDTLRVVLHVPNAVPDTLCRAMRLPVDTALVATLECLIANVQRWPSLRYLTVNVAGRRDLAKYDHTWDVAAIRPDAVSREFVW